MKLRFQPMPGLTIVTIIALAILIALGTWQYQRLQWKTAFLADIESVADAPPFTTLADVRAALDAGEPIDFRRIEVVTTPIEVAPFFVFTAAKRDISWRVFLPVNGGGQPVFAALNTISDTQKADYTHALTGKSFLKGYVRAAQPRQRGETQSSPEKNRWFGFNSKPDTHNWGDSVTGGADMRFYIDTVDGAQSADLLPTRRPGVRNNHFDYMLTWYGLALVLLVIYAIMHKRAGRLGLS